VITAPPEMTTTPPELDEEPLFVVVVEVVVEDEDELLEPELPLKRLTGVQKTPLRLYPLKQAMHCPVRRL
jgi:hypothetical protein